MATDLYEVLGVSREASADDIKRAYRRLARELHPDVNPDEDTQHRFKEISAAYDVLSDPDKRSAYDRGGSPFGGNGFEGFGFGDIVDAFFGGGSQRGPRPRHRRGQDALIRIEVDLAEAAFGGVRELQIDTAVLCEPCQGAGTAPGTGVTTCDVCKGRGEVQTVQRSFLGQVVTNRPCPQCRGYGNVIPHPCPECAGEGRVGTRRSLEIKVPQGIADGMRIHLPGEGEIGPGGGPAGDLYVEVSVLPHPVFTRRGDDLHCPITVPMTAAALGATLQIDTLDGPADIVVRPGTQSGTQVLLDQRGVGHLRGSGRGNLVVHIDVQTPTKLDARQEELLRELSALRGEEQPRAQVGTAQAKKLFDRVRDAFNGR